MLPPRGRGVLVVVGVALVAGIFVVAPPLNSFQGLSIDALTALRWRLLGNIHSPGSSPSVVIAIDEESYRTPPFANSPNLTWTREIGRVVDSVIEGGAKVVGFDVIFPTSIEQAEVPFGEGTLGERVRGFDRDFLRSLATGARAGKLVLGQVQHQSDPIRPSPGQRIAVGQQRNIRALNAYSDNDEVIRRLPLSFVIDGEQSPSMAVELAARAQNAVPEFGNNGLLSIAGYQIPSTTPNTMTLNFAGGGGDIPTFSLADLRACAEKDDLEFFRRHFNGKVVLVGTVLDVEDRKITSKRYATGIEGGLQERCALPQKTGAAQFSRNTIAGVYIHATAINNIIQRDALSELGQSGRGLISLIFAVIAAIIALRFTPIVSAAGFVALAAAWTVGATLAMQYATVLPLFEPLMAGFAALIVMTGYRFIVTDKDKRLLRKSFALYLAPQLIDKMMESSAPPSLGGELRTVTIFFSDIAGFTELSERMKPTDLVAMMNAYLSEMTTIIESHQGFVDKYVGDAIVAVFGAPLDDPEHAKNAVLAAMACRKRLQELNDDPAALYGNRLHQRIGLHTGEALVGNIGSQRRFNYTVIGDAVNLASRLEGANKYFGTSIVASGATVRGTGQEFQWRELDTINVKGRAQSLAIFEPISEMRKADAGVAQTIASYARGLQNWRARNFAEAAECFSASAQTDPPSAFFLRRAREFIKNPPDGRWEAVYYLEGK